MCWGMRSAGGLRGTAGVKGLRQHVGGRHCWLDIKLGKNEHGGEPEGGVAGAWNGRGTAGNYRG